MDFFAHQDRARRNTGLLIFYFIIAVLLIVLAVNGVVYFFINFFATAQVSSIPNETRLSDVVWVYITLGTVAFIALGSLFRFAALARGGEAVAEMVSAREVDRSTREIEERKYINVVEEMSIASGVPAPRLYVMDDEEGINAFVAGYKPTQAVMVVTRGALQNLNRDELQGVVGHEFSHILNGDMRINVRLMAILAGILLIGKFGEILMRGTRYSRKQNKGMILGLALFIVGYLGLFFGRLIKAAISRQREFLADASAVQFTRNSDGIAGALYKIQQSMNGTLLHNSHAEDMSHMCFGQALRFGFGGLLATHPPLEVRINSIDAGYLKHRQQLDWTQAATSAAAPDDSVMVGMAAATPVQADALADSVGNPGPEHLAFAHSLYSQIDEDILQRVHQVPGAQALLYAMVISKTEQTIARSFMQQQLSNELVDEIDHQLLFVRALDHQLRLPMIDMAIATLQPCSEQQLQPFLRNLEKLIKLDKKLSLLEFVLLTIVQRRLDSAASRVVHVRYRSFKTVMPEIELLLSLVARTGAAATEKMLSAYRRNVTSFGSASAEPVSASAITIPMINQALHKLNQMPAMMKKSLLTACADLAIDDGVIMPAEVELIRAVAEALDCPMPPLLPGPARRAL